MIHKVMKSTVTLMKLSVSFWQVWHGAVCTLTTESSERSTRAGRNGQAHHMMLQEKTHT